MHLTAVLIGIVGLTLLGAEPPKQDDTVAAELKKLEGTWTVIRTEQDGRVLDKGEVGSNLVTFAGTKCTIVSRVGAGQEKLTLENTFTIDPSRVPKWMDVTSVKPKQTWKGIYELKDDTLRAVFRFNSDAVRPREFKTRACDSAIMYTYRRVKK